MQTDTVVLDVSAPVEGAIERVEDYGISSAPVIDETRVREHDR